MLNITDLGMKFPGESGQSRIALDGIHLMVPAGEFVCILGPSGCGKTTLLRIIAGLQSGYSGTIGYDTDDTRVHTAVVFQEHALFPWLNVEKNVEYGLRLAARTMNDPGERTVRVQKYLELCRMKDSAGAYPYELSGGMRQRVAVARALAVEPDVLLMDEPFSALDSTTRSQLQDEVIRIHQVTSRTILMVTHNAEEAVLLADRIIVLTKSPGRIRADIRVSSPRPRGPDDPDIIRIRKEVTEMLKDSP